MKKYLLVCISFSVVFSANVSESYKIKGMHCDYGCVNKVKTVMGSIEGMKKYDVDFENSLLNVEYDNSIVDSKLIITTLTDNTTFDVRLNTSKKSFWTKFKTIFGK